MKNTSITKFLVLALAIMMAISPMSAFAEDTSASIDLIPWMHTAYQSIDAFDPDPAMKPSVEDINTIMEAACLAQSSTNTQPWYFLVLTDSTQYDITKTGLGCSTFNEGSVAIVVCCAEAMGSGWLFVNGYYDAGAAVGYMTLAAASKGYGVHVYSKTKPNDYVSALVPEGYVAKAIVVMGTPAVDSTASGEFKGVRHANWGIDGVNADAELFNTKLVVKTKPSVKEYATLADTIDLSGLVLNICYYNNVLLETVKYDEADPALFTAEFVHQGTAVAVSYTYNGEVYTAEYAVTVQNPTDVTTSATTDASSGASEK